MSCVKFAPFRLYMPQNTTFVNHYTVLDVCHAATQEEIESSFKRKLSTCQRGEVPDDVRAVVLTRAYRSRLEHACCVLLDEHRRAEFDNCLMYEMKKPQEMIERVESYLLEPPFDSFGIAIKSVAAQPPPKGKWNAVLPQDPLWDVWAEMGVELRSVQEAAKRVALSIYQLNDWGAQGDRIPASRDDDEQAWSSSDYWKAQSLLFQIVGHYAKLYPSLRKLYTTARDTEPFQIHVKMRIAIQQLRLLHRLLKDTLWYLDLLQMYANRKTENFIWTQHAAEFIKQMARSCRVWRVMRDLPKFSDADQVDDFVDRPRSFGQALQKKILRSKLDPEEFFDAPVCA